MDIEIDFTVSVFAGRAVEVEFESFRDKSWRKPADFGFVAKEPVIPLAMAELPVATHFMPIAIVKSGSEFEMVALAGLLSESSLMVDKANRWIGRYLPEALKHYPFVCPRQAKAEGSTSNFILSDSGLVEDSTNLPGDESYHCFYQASGEVGEVAAGLFADLSRYTLGRLEARGICQVLDELGLIEPWPIMLKDASGGESEIRGLFRINESAFQSLEPDKREIVWTSNGLLLIYCQMLSVQHISSLGELLVSGQS